MKKVSDIKLEKLWEDITGQQKYEIVKQLVKIEKSFTATRFTSFESLYYTENVLKVFDNEILCVNEDETEMQCSSFIIDFMNNQMFFNERCETVHVNWEPCIKTF